MYVHDDSIKYSRTTAGRARFEGQETLPQRSRDDGEARFRQINHASLLTADNERDLSWRVVNEDCSESRQRLIRAHQHLVAAIARRYESRGIPLDVLIIAGEAGLERAVDDFDPDQGMRFSTHSSWWIKHGIRNAIAHFVARPAREARVQGLDTSSRAASKVPPPGTSY